MNTPLNLITVWLNYPVVWQLAHSVLCSLSVFNVVSIFILHLKFESSPPLLSTVNPPLWITGYPVALTGNCWCCCESHASKCSYLILIDCKMSQQWQVNGKCNLMHALHQHQTAAEKSFKYSPTFGKWQNETSEFVQRASSLLSHSVF